MHFALRYGVQVVWIVVIGIQFFNLNAVESSQKNDGPFETIAGCPIGISDKNLKRLFRPFVQIEVSNSRKYQETGLGLALARKLVELHDGRIWADSRSVGKGCTFTFILPNYQK